jgi:anaerobic magnesium-protoporphyrin IX monomethyl ester cyclase
LNHPESVPGVYYRDGGKVRYTGIPDLPDFATLPSPHRILDPKPYQEEFFQLGVQTKRGCAHKCLYCDYPYLNGGKIRQRHPRLVVNELQHLAREQGIRRFAFADAIFNEPREHAEQICRDIVQRGLDLKWTAYFSIRCFDQDFLELATKAGCELFEFSPDGLRESTLRALQKGIGEDEIQRVMSLFEGRRQPRFALQLMFNVPGAEFKDFLLLCHAVFVWPRKYPSLEFVAITNMRIYPRTPLHRLAINERLILPEQNLVQPMFYDPWPLRPFSVLIHFGGRVRRGIMKLCGTYRF